MVVAVVSLVVALLCVLYVVERPGTIAIGSPVGNTIRVIEYGYLGPVNFYEVDYWRRSAGELFFTKVWDGVDVTVPEGKSWIVIVSPAYGPHEVADELYYTYGRTYIGFYEVTAEVAGRFEIRPGSFWTVLGSGTYHDLDLVISTSMVCMKATAPLQVLYVVLEVDSELER